MAFLITTLLLLIVTHGRYLTGEWLYYHDSHVTYLHMHLFFDALFRGELPLWSPEINGGEPLWPIAETYPAFDPCALMLWSVAKILGVPSAVAYQWTQVAWLFLFSWGGMKLSQRISPNIWIQLTVFAFLFGGPIAISLPQQSTGFIVPFRYLTIALFLFLNFEKRPTAKHATWLGLVLACSHAGYQSGFFVFCFCLFALLYHLWNTVRVRQKGYGTLNFWKNRLKYYAWVLLIILVGWAPTIVAGFEMMQLFPVGRIYYPYGWTIEWETLWKHFLDPLFVSPAPHGSGYFGIVMAVLLPLGFYALAIGWLPLGRRKAASRRLRSTAEEFAYGGLALVCLLISVRVIDFRTAHFLSLRNWGFLLTPMTLCLALVSVSGFKKAKDMVQLPVAWGGYLVFGGFVLFRFGWDERLCLYLASPIFVAAAFWFVINKRKTYHALSVFIFLVQVSSSVLMSKNQAFYMDEDLIGHFPPEPGTRSIKFSDHRQWAFPTRAYLPFHYQGASVYHLASATTPPFAAYHIDDSTGRIYAEDVTHQFRLPDYHQLMSSKISPNVLKQILGVAQPIVRVFSQVDALSDRNQMIAWLQRSKSQIDLENKAVVIGEESLSSSDTSGWGTWSLMGYGSSYLKLKVQSLKRSLLVYSDNITQDWSVFVNGAKVSLLQANGTAKAVWIDAHSKWVEFRYRPTRYIVVFILRALFYLGVFIFIGIQGVNTTRRALYRIGAKARRVLGETKLTYYSTSH